MFSFIRVFLLFFCGAAGYYYFFKSRESRKFEIPLELKIYFGFILITIVSIIYSIDARSSFIRSFSLIALLGNVLGLYAWLNYEKRQFSLINILFYVVIFIFSINIIYGIVFHDRAWLTDINMRFRGVFSHPNSFGSFCMVSYSVLFWKFLHSRYFLKIMIFITILAMILFHILSGSRSSFISSIVICILWLVLRKKAKIITVALLLLFLFIIIFQIKTGSLNTFSRNVRSENELTNLTGREEIWTEAINLIVKRPFLGYGYEVSGKIFSSPLALYNIPNLEWLANSNESFHNGYITIALGLGFIGLFPWLFIIFSPGLRLIKKVNTEFILVSLSIMFSCLILNFAEYAINPGASLSSIFFWVAWVLSLHIIQSFKISLGSCN